MTPDPAASRRGRRLLTVGLPALAIVVAAAAAACSGGSGSGRSAAAPDGSRSSTIAWAADGGTLWTTSPDDDRVVRIDPKTLAVVEHVDVPGQPRELAVADDLVAVTGAQSTALAVIDTTADAAEAVDLVPIPCGGSKGVVVVPSGQAEPTTELAVVTCPADDRLAVVDLQRAIAVGTIPLAGRPTGIVRDHTTITVSTALDGRLHTYDTGEIGRAAAAGLADGGPDPRRLAVTPTSKRRAWADEGRAPSSLAALDAGPRGPVGVYQVVDNQRKLTRAEIEAGSTYGSPKDGRARLEPAVAGPCGARFASLTDEPRRLSGPVAVAAAPTGDLVWVVGEFSHSVSVVRCAGAAASTRSATVAAFDVGEGARGIVLDDRGRTAFVDIGFDHEIARLELPDGAVTTGSDDVLERTEPAAVGRRPVDDRYLSPLAQEGRRMFNDATNAHLTPFGVVTCGSCHPAAGEDGMTWRIERVDATTKGIERKVRRTPPAWQVDVDTKPLHWDGEFTSSDDLSLTTIQQLLGGDGLLVDTAALSAYMAEVSAPPTTPTGDTAQTASDAQAGEALLARLGCTTCHAGDAGTDGLAHDVLAPSAVPDGDLAAAITPPLRGVRGRAPYGHDGRAADLRALLLAHGDGKGAPIELTDDQLAAVTAYLRTR